MSAAQVGGAPRIPFSEIVAQLNDNPELVIERYCSIAGAYRDHQGRHFCLNPCRPDRNVGSFYVNLTGAFIGKWRDHATGEHGDMLDLIQKAEPCDNITAIKIAKGLLGIEDTSKELRQAMAWRAEDRKRRRAQMQAELEAERARKERAAQALWLSAEARIGGTPVEAYLKHTRGIDLRALGRQPGALRFHPACSFEGHDPETGEVIEGKFPAMLAAMNAVDGRFTGCHRTWLAERRGRWDKLIQGKGAKKTYGTKKGCGIHVWNGIGPRGGAAGPLHKAPEGQRLYVTEGVEDALSVVMLAPEVRVWAAVDLGNMAEILLPDQVREVVLVADNDMHDEAQAALRFAVQVHAKAGRLVRVWRNTWGGKDLNDALLAAQRDGGSDAA